MKKLHIARIGCNVISAIFFFTALLYLLFPKIPSLVICVFSGLLLLAYGTIKIIGYFSEDLFCLAFRYDLAFGLLLLAIGVLVLVRYKTAAAYLPGASAGSFFWTVFSKSRCRRKPGNLESSSGVSSRRQP